MPTKAIFGSTNFRCAGIRAMTAKGAPGSGKIRSMVPHGGLCRSLLSTKMVCRWLTRIPAATPETHSWNYGFYWILDQMLYREPSQAWPAVGLGKDGKSVSSSKASEQTAEAASNQGLGWFGRIAFGPQNRNFVGFYFDTGLVYTGTDPYPR